MLEKFLKFLGEKKLLQARRSIDSEISRTFSLEKRRRLFWKENSTVRHRDRLVSLLPHDRDWQAEFTFHADEAAVAGHWLALLACSGREQAELPLPPMPLEYIEDGRQAARNLLSIKGYVWTAKALKAYEADRTTEEMRKQRIRVWRAGQTAEARS